MVKIEDCPGFETFGTDVKEARKAKNLARKDLAEMVNIDSRYNWRFMGVTSLLLEKGKYLFL